MVTHPPAWPSPLHASPGVHAQGRGLSCPQEILRQARPAQCAYTCACIAQNREASLLALHALSLSQHRRVSSPDLDAWRSKKPDRCQVYTPLEQSSPKLNSTGGMFILRSCNLTQAKPYKRFLRPGTVASAKHKTFSPCSLEFDRNVSERTIWKFSSSRNFAMFRNGPFVKKFEKKIYIKN